MSETSMQLQNTMNVFMYWVMKESFTSSVKRRSKAYSDKQYDETMQDGSMATAYTPQENHELDHDWSNYRRS